MVISEQKKVDEICQKFQTEDVIALDTEFLWTKTYIAQPSLLQIASPNEHYIIDLLAIEDYRSIGRLLSADTIKIFHSGEQDLKLLKELTGTSCKNFFDSQLAASFLNLDFQISYNRLIEHYCKIDLGPSVSHLNWLERPLTQQQIDYALNDVIYLIKIYPQLIKDLKESNKIEWFQEDIISNFSENFYKKKSKLSYHNIKNWRDLPSNKLAILDKLVIMRDQIAQDINKRPHFTLPDSLLVYLCHKKELNHQVMQSIKMNSTLKSKYQDKIINSWQQGKDVPTSDYPVEKKKPSISPKYRLAENKLKELIPKIAQQHNLHPTLLLPRDKQRKIITAWSENNQFNHLLNNWRKKILEDQLLKILQKIYV